VVVADDLRDAPRAAFKLPHADELRLAHNSVVLRERMEKSVDSDFSTAFNGCTSRVPGTSSGTTIWVIGKGDSARTALAGCRGFDKVSFDRLYEARDRRVPHPALTARPSKWPRP
jgi:hypothetical protein